jgi:cytochrome b involved in lipid metabolism
MRTFVVILILVVLIIGAYLMWGRGDEVEINNSTTNVPAQNETGSPQATSTATSTPNTSNPSTGSTSSPQASSGQATYTIAQVATHNKSTDCWVAINSKVYNLTSWISKHPGGQQAILSICGKDATVTFSNQHSGQARPEAMLSTFLIGSIK